MLVYCQGVESQGTTNFDNIYNRESVSFLLPLKIPK